MTAPAAPATGVRLLPCKACDGTGFTEDDDVCMACMKTGDANWQDRWKTASRFSAPRRTPIPGDDDDR